MLLLEAEGETPDGGVKGRLQSNQMKARKVGSNVLVSFVELIKNKWM